MSDYQPYYAAYLQAYPDGASRPGSEYIVWITGKWAAFRSIDATHRAQTTANRRKFEAWLGVAA